MENLEENKNNLETNLEAIEAKSGINIETNENAEVLEDKKDDVSEEKEELEEEATITETDAEIDKIEKEEEKEEDKEEKEIEIEVIQWNTLSKEEILNKITDLINNEDALFIRNNISLAKNEFYKKHNAEIEELKAKFISEKEEDEKEDDFVAPEDKIENEFKIYINIYREKRTAKVKSLEKQKEDNLKRKQEIIEEIKELVKSQEKVNVTFQGFKKLQTEFNNIGDIPQKEVKTIWNNFNTAREIFYDYLDINRELRDLDFKKSYNQKIKLCEEAEKLEEQENIIEAHNTLQRLHENWKIIGPINPEKREEIWERFSAITKIINKKHQDFYDGLKVEKDKNLNLKEELCSKIEALSEESHEKIKEWNEVSSKVSKLQDEWKKVGPTPKNTNKEIYKRFRIACDNFYEKKKEYYGEIKKEQQVNLQEKYDLCEKVESLSESEDWKNTTNKIINLQKEWKNIGPVPRKKSDQVWNRFRTACDNFFNRRSEQSAVQSEKEKENLILKQELNTKLEKFEHLEDVNETIAKLKEFQKEWNNIGFVPLDSKKEINTSFKNNLNKHYDKLNIDSKEKDMLRLRSKLEELLSHSDSIEKLKIEKDKLIKRISQFESETVLLENNIGFFNSSKNADKLLKDIKNKINTARANIDLLKDKLKVINQHINKASKQD
jgi:hypothetical protein